MVAAAQYDPNYIPVRGDVIGIDFSPQAGREIWDWRPALVLSSWYFNSTKNVAVMCPITRTGRGGAFEIEIPIGIDVQGVIRADQVKSQDWRERRSVFWCEMPDDTVKAVSQIVETIIWGDL